MAGMVLETNINHILSSINEQNKLHASSIKVVPAQAAAMGAAAGSAIKDVGGKVFSTISTALSRS